MNLTDLIDWLRCTQNLTDDKCYEFCGYMGCHGLKCSVCREIAIREAANALESYISEQKEDVTTAKSMS